MLGITGKLGFWLYHFLTGRTHFVRLQAGVSIDSAVISGVSQGTVLGQLLFIILMCDINSGITSSSLVSFTDDMRLYYGISNVDTSLYCNVYTSSSLDIIDYFRHVVDLGINIYVSSDCSFKFNITLY